jgi:hypothetical protein
MSPKSFRRSSLHIIPDHSSAAGRSLLPDFVGQGWLIIDDGLRIYSSVTMTKCTSSSL